MLYVTVVRMRQYAIVRFSNCKECKTCHILLQLQAWIDLRSYLSAIRNLKMTLKHTLQPFSGIPTLKCCKLRDFTKPIKTGDWDLHIYVFTSFMPTATKIMLATSPTIGHHSKLLHRVIPAYSSISKRVDFQSHYGRKIQQSFFRSDHRATY